MDATQKLRIGCLYGRGKVVDAVREVPGGRLSSGFLINPTHLETLTVGHFPYKGLCVKSSFPQIYPQFIP